MYYSTSSSFSRLFVYLSVFLLLSSSASAMPTHFVKDPGTARVDVRDSKFDLTIIPSDVASKVTQVDLSNSPADAITHQSSNNPTISFDHARRSLSNVARQEVQISGSTSGANTPNLLGFSGSPLTGTPSLVNSLSLVSIPDPKNPTQGESGLGISLISPSDIGVLGLNNAGGNILSPVQQSSTGSVGVTDSKVSAQPPAPPVSNPLSLDHISAGPLSGLGADLDTSNGRIAVGNDEMNADKGITGGLVPKLG